MQSQKARAVEEERTSALANFIKEVTDKQAEVLSNLSEGQKEMAEAIKQISEVQNMDTELVKLPDGSRRTRKVKRS